MFMLIVNYTKPEEEVSKHKETHSIWVKKYIDQGIFLLAGPNKNKLGGAILAKSLDEDMLNKILSEDSYVKAEVAEYQIIQFDCKASTSELEFLKTA
jgi:uncharacterized protein YciI